MWANECGEKNIFNETKNGKKRSDCVIWKMKLTVVPCCFIACSAIAFNLSRYNWAARELYFCWASVVVQLCWRKNCAAFAFPPNCICLNWIHVQFVSKFVDRTNVKWTPKLRWTAEQSIQMKTPYVTDDHVGFFALQSKHVWKAKTQHFEQIKSCARLTILVYLVYRLSPKTMKYGFNISFCWSTRTSHRSLIFYSIFLYFVNWTSRDSAL